MSGLSFGAVVRTATILATVLAEPAAAQTQQVDWCVNKNSASSLDRQISGCTAAIASGKWKDRGLAWAYYNRGNAYRAEGDLDRAIADYNEAIRLDRKYALAYNARSDAYRAKGDLDRAITDYNEAIRLDPKVSAPYNGRANA
jgi:tetratricopeptide (TPR) repeat protein